MTAARIRDKDKGARRVTRALGRGRVYTEVGIIGANADKTEAEGITVADVATWAEFGLGQPRRSWLRDWVDQHEAEIRERIGKEIRAVIEGKRTKKQALARVGVWAVGQIQLRIANHIPPPNAPLTIARKGSSTPLIDKGQFRSSITSRVAEDDGKARKSFSGSRGPKKGS